MRQCLIHVYRTAAATAPLCICVSYLCFDSYDCCTAYHSELSVCVFYFYTFLTFFLSLFCMFVCLVLWASLSEIKIDDDDNDEDDC